MKKLILLLTLISSSIFAEPIQLQPAPTPTPTPMPKSFTPLAPVMLSGSQVATLFTAIAGTNLLVMPDGYSLADMRHISLAPVTSGSNAGKVRLVISVEPK